jgi:hypothetical protein
MPLNLLSKTSQKVRSSNYLSTDLDPRSCTCVFLPRTGRTARQSTKSPAVSTVAQARLNRRNTQKQAQATKRASLVAATRIFNGTDGAPRIVAIIPLSEDVDTRACIEALGRCVDEEIHGINENKNIWAMKFVPSTPSSCTDLTTHTQSIPIQNIPPIPPRSLRSPIRCSRCSPRRRLHAPPALPDYRSYPRR